MIFFKKSKGSIILDGADFPTYTKNNQQLQQGFEY